MQRFAFFPSQPKKGTTYKLFYDFSDLPSEVTSVSITGAYTSGDTESATITRGVDDTGWIEVDAPLDESGVIWVDLSGNSVACGVIFY